LVVLIQSAAAVVAASSKCYANVAAAAVAVVHSHRQPVSSSSSVLSLFCSRQLRQPVLVLERSRVLTVTTPSMFVELRWMMDSTVPNGTVLCSVVISSCSTVQNSTYPRVLLLHDGMDGLVKTYSPVGADVWTNCRAGPATSWIGFSNHSKVV
jgi:hypothetical protein